MLVAKSMTRRSATSRESYLRLQFARSFLNFITWVFGRVFPNLEILTNSTLPNTRVQEFGLSQARVFEGPGGWEAGGEAGRGRGRTQCAFSVQANFSDNGLGRVLETLRPRGLCRVLPPSMNELKIEIHTSN